MAFTIYNSSDSGAPTLNGNAGSLLTVLDAVLVTGYGAKTAAGWWKPFPNTSSYGMYMQGTGSSTCSLFVYDNASGSVGAEAQLTGWDSITAIDNGKVTGSNQFPTVAQVGPGSGSVTVRKSTTSDSTARAWYIFADSHSMYGFIQALDADRGYRAFMFGDYYSIRSGSVETNRCIIMGRNVGSSSTVAGDRLDVLGASLLTGVNGCYAAHLYSGLGTSSLLNKHGDGIKGSTTALNGNVPFLNPQDNGFYISPIWLADSSTGIVRGRMRGFYQICHATTSLVDAQTFTSSADFPGRTFQVVQKSANAGTYFIETSNTLETNNP